MNQIFGIDFTICFFSVLTVNNVFMVKLTTKGQDLVLISWRQPQETVSCTVGRSVTL